MGYGIHVSICIFNKKITCFLQLVLDGVADIDVEYEANDPVSKYKMSNLASSDVF